MPSREPWLVRTSLGEIHGPFSEEQLKGRLKEGLCAGDDEICRAGDYWFRLYERAEVVSKLGPEIPMFYPRTVTPEEELTQTETETTAILQTDPTHDFGAKKPPKNPASSGKDLWKILVGILAVMLVIRLLQFALRSE